MNDSLCFIHKHSTLDAIEGSLTYSNWYRFIYIGNLFQLSWAVFNTLLPITNKDHSKWHIISTGIRVPAVTSVSWNERLNVCVPRVAFKLTYCIASYFLQGANLAFCEEVMKTNSYESCWNKHAHVYWRKAAKYHRLLCINNTPSYTRV